MLESRAVVGMIVATVLAAGTACGSTVKSTEKPWGPLSTPATPHLPPGSRASINHTLDVFVRNGVERRDPTKAYAVASSMMRIGQTRKQWNEGTLPVPPYRTRGTRFHGYTVMSASPRQVYLTMVLQPRYARKQGAVAYNIRLSKSPGGSWLIDWFTPSAFFAAKGQTPKLFAEPDLAPSLGAPSLTHKSHANLIMWGVLALLLIPLAATVAFFFGAFGSRVGWRRRPADDATWAAAFRPDDR
jgi:hypothetical protein